MSESTKLIKQKIINIEDSSKNSIHRRYKGAGAQPSYFYGAADVDSGLRLDFDHSAPAPHLNSNSVEEQSDFSYRQWLTPKQRRLEHFANRVQDCKFMDWAHLVCNDCGNIVKEKAFHLSCLSPFCKNPECIKNRIRINKALLQSYGIYTKRLYHFVVGFEPVKELTNSFRLKCDLLAKKFIKQIRSKFPNVYLIMVRDINQTTKGLRVHYHIGGFGIKDFRFFSVQLQNITKSLSECSRTPLIVSLGGYSKREGIFNYFSKRASGVFGHTSKGDDFYYSDFMKLKEYFEVFYNKRKIWFYLNNLRVRRTELIRLISHSVEKCPYCSSKSFRFSPVNTFKPPPDKFCSECGIYVDARDWNYSLGCCRACAYHKSPGYKDKIFQREFKKFLEGKRGPLNSHEQII